MLVELFKDDDVELIRRAGSIRVCPNGITIVLPTVFGFCNGVRGAIRGVNQALSRHPPEKVWIIGEIIHNPTVNQALRQAGVNMLEEKETLNFLQTAKDDDVVVVPAFGMEKYLAEILERQLAPKSIVDTTCIYVKRAWKFVEQATAQGHSILVFGDPGHQEIKATVSRVDSRETAIVYLRTPEAARHLAGNLRQGKLESWPVADMLNPHRFNPRRLALICQTTLLGSDIQQVVEILQAAMKDIDGQLMFANTICRATQQRQSAALAMARQGCDPILVIGGYSSSNTNQLYRIAKDFAEVYFIRDETSLEASWITHYRPELKQEQTRRDWLRPGPRRIGILAGASCPASDIGAVIRKISRIERSMSTKPSSQDPCLKACRKVADRGPGYRPRGSFES